MSFNNRNTLGELDWRQAVVHLSKVEPVFAELARLFPNEFIRSSGSAFQVLANSIVGQQISVKAAAAIFGRLTALLGRWEPAAVDGVTDEQLRSAGLSVRKVQYFRGLAAAFVDGVIDPRRWESETDAQVMKELISLKGIGRWTAEMFLIFHLKRPDVFPIDDIGLLKSAARAFGWEYPFDPQRLEARAEAWRPWRTVGVWYLWRALDPQLVVY